MTETEKEIFEIERIASIRTFEIVVWNGAGKMETEQHFAHYHSTDDAGNLSLVVIQPDGQQLIQHLFNAATWSRLTEIGVSEKTLKGKIH